MDDITTAKILLKTLDLTSLGKDDNEFKIEKLCEKARTKYGNVAAVCVYPKFIPQVKKLLQGSDIKIATVVNFPEGGCDFEKLRTEIKEAIKSGAEEIDAVFPYKNFLNNDLPTCEEFLKIVKEECGKKQTTKVILETGEITKTSLIAKASQMCIAKGINFIKTSTGKSKISATPEAANIILETISNSQKPVGFKASGGIKTFEDARKYLILANSIMGPKWLSAKNFRIGASSLIDDLIKVIERDTNVSTRNYPQKRNKQNLTSDEISFFIKGVTSGEIADSQTAALTMAVFLNGFTAEETVALTLAMRDSGDVLQWKDLNGPVVDKHSSGGVGDKVSLMLAPMIAACGGYVPMISGRGLGHTGGTLDKFDAIPGYQTIPSNELFVKTVKETGCAIIGQTGNLAPADKKIYAIRDVCGTVESIPLITASILSKKLAAGLDCLVMDLKCGNGAFMDNLEDARSLAKSIVRVANGAGTKTNAVLTDMNQVLGRVAGNAVEVAEAVQYLKGENIDTRLHKVTMQLCAELLVSAKLAKDIKEAETKLQKSLDSGKALEIFAKMVTGLGGPTDFCEKPEKYLPKAQIIRPVYAEKQGYVSHLQTRDIGMSVIGLKGGRTHPDQHLNYATGFTDFCQIGDYIDESKPLAFIHATTEDEFEKAATEIQKYITISENKPAFSDVIIEKIGV